MDPQEKSVIESLFARLHPRMGEAASSAARYRPLRR